jgi:ubiquinone/menaquinone biosynthesis C-methylase UbiE
MTTSRHDVGGFQLDEPGPSSYHRYLVPHFFAPLADRLLKATRPRSGERVLDLACGTGVVARRVADSVGPAQQTIGIDRNPSMIDFARSRGGQVERSDVEWLVGDAENLPLSDAWADVCYCQQGWQFFADQPAAAGELARVSRTGARLALTMWRAIEHNPVFAILVAALDKVVGSEAAATMRAPFAGPDAAVLRQQLETAGFDSIGVRITTLAVRFPSVREFLRREAAGSTLGLALQEEAEQVLASLDRVLERSLEPYVDDDGLVLPMQTWLITARRARGDHHP